MLSRVIRYALSSFHFLRKVHFSVFQCTLYLKLYQTFASEEGDGADGADSQIFNGVLIHMAYSLGIHREPRQFKHGFKDEKHNNLCRKIWHYLVFSDITHTFPPLPSKLL